MLRLTNIRANQKRKMGDPGPEGSIGKMACANLNIDIYEKVMDLLGADGMLYGSYEMIRPETAMGFDTLQKAFLRSRANTIEGGTTEVMLNILGERVLGLPGDVRVDRDVPGAKFPATDPSPVQRVATRRERGRYAHSSIAGEERGRMRTLRSSQAVLMDRGGQGPRLASMSLAPRARSSMLGRSSRLPPSITVDTVSIAA